MGYLKNKYTEEYFTGRNRKSGKLLGFGVEGYDSFIKGEIRNIDLSILSQINFKGQRILEFGFGRGEAIKYAMERGAISYTGVDFAKAAINIAKSFLKAHNIKGPILYQSDALEFLKKYTKKSNYQKFDVILLLDVIEHIPRKELSDIFKYIKKIQSKKSILVINTPAYKFDNDVLKDGLDVRNNLDSFDTSDLREETKGMHCNKYSKISLQKFMSTLGFLNISECHFYVNKNVLKSKWNSSYLERWNSSFNDGFPVQESYEKDLIDSPYVNDFHPVDYEFNQGHMSGIRLFIAETYIKAAFPGGEHDKAMFEDVERLNLKDGIIFDVGGFIGISSLLFAKYTSENTKIYSFEPNPYNIDRLFVNISLNPELGKSIQAINIALGDQNTIANILLSNAIDNGYSSTSRLENTHVEHSEEYLKNIGFFKQRVILKKLDDFIIEKRIKPDIIKLDIEGAEHLFLYGAKSFLTKNNPILYIELHSQFCTMQCINFLSKLGYESHFLSEEEDGRIILKFTRKHTLESISNASIVCDIYENKINELSVNNRNLLKSYSKLESQYVECKKYLSRLENNMIIKIQLITYVNLKKFIQVIRRWQKNF